MEIITLLFFLKSKWLILFLIADINVNCLLIISWITIDWMKKLMVEKRHKLIIVDLIMVNNDSITACSCLNKEFEGRISDSL